MKTSWVKTYWSSMFHRNLERNCFHVFKCAGNILSKNTSIAIKQCFKEKRKISDTLNRNGTSLFCKINSNSIVSTFNNEYMYIHRKKVSWTKCSGWNAAIRKFGTIQSLSSLILVVATWYVKLKMFVSAHTL